MPNQITNLNRFRWRPTLDENQKRAIAATEHPKFNGTMIPFGAFLIVQTGVPENYWQAYNIPITGLAMVGVVGLMIRHLAKYGFAPHQLEALGFSSWQAHLLGLLKVPALMGGILSWGLLALSAVVVDLCRPLPISMMGLWLGFTLLGCHLWLGTCQKDLSSLRFTARLDRQTLSVHYLVRALIVLVTSLTPLLGLLPSYCLYANASIFGATTGSILVIGGALDLALLRDLAKPISN